MANQPQTAAPPAGHEQHLLDGVLGNNILEAIAAGSELLKQRRSEARVQSTAWW